MHQAAIGVSLDCAAVIGYRYMRPLIERRDIASVNEQPARIAVGKSPLNRAVGKPGNHILAFFNENGAAHRGV